MKPRGNARVAVVLGATELTLAWQSNLDRFCDEVGGQGEVILVVGNVTTPPFETGSVRVIQAPEARLVPELWALGLEQTVAEFVAFSTPSMRPVSGWLSALIADMHTTDAAAVGGPIEPGDGLAPFDKAVYLHRYLNYAMPWPKAGALDPAGENVLYRRSSIAGLQNLWAEGFWEAAVNRALRQRRERLVMTPEAVVHFAGGVNSAAILSQRIHHARHYASCRARQWSASERCLRLAMSPAVPALLVARVLRRLRALDEPLSRWTVALPHLARLATLWSIGEALGIARGPRMTAAPSRAPMLEPGLTSWR